MNADFPKKNERLDQNSYESLLILDEIQGNRRITQRYLSRKHGISLGVVNSYIKNLAAKGYVRITSLPRNRYKYILTPKGFLEKSRLAYHHLQDFTKLYTRARHDFRELFKRLYEDGVKRVVFCGTDEVAEIAYLSLQEADIELVGVVDGRPKRERKRFFSFNTLPYSELKSLEYDKVVMATFIEREALYERLCEEGIPEDKIIGMEVKNPI